MAKRIEMYEVNCAVISDEGGSIWLDLANRKEPVKVRASHCTLTMRRPNPNNPMSLRAAKTYPRVLRMPLAMAEQYGIA